MAAAIGECRSPLGAVEALRHRAGWSPRFLPLRTVSDAEALLARLRLAGPERPKDLEGRLEHIAERLYPPRAAFRLAGGTLCGIAPLSQAS